MKSVSAESPGGSGISHGSTLTPRSAPNRGQHGGKYGSEVFGCAREQSGRHQAGCTASQDQAAEIGIVGLILTNLTGRGVKKISLQKGGTKNFREIRRKMVRCRPGIQLASLKSNADLPVRCLHRGRRKRGDVHD